MSFNFNNPFMQGGFPGNNFAQPQQQQLSDMEQKQLLMQQQQQMFLMFQQSTEGQQAIQEFHAKMNKWHNMRMNPTQQADANLQSEFDEFKKQQQLMQQQQAEMFEMLKKQNKSKKE